MKKLLLGIAALVVIALIVFFNQNSSLEEQYVVRIGHLPIMPSKLPIDIALEQGFFEEEGLKVEITQIASSNLVSDALIRGDIDVTPEISVIPYLTADLIDHGKIKIFSVMDLTTDIPFDSVIVSNDSPIQSISDLQGKKVGLFPGTTATNMLKLYMKQQGIDSSSTQFVQLPPTEHLNALYAGSVDALFAYEPTVAVGAADGKTRTVFGSVYATLLNHSPLGAGLISASFVQEHPEEAARVVAAINKAYDYMESKDTETRKLMAQTFKFDPAVAESVNISYFKHSDAVDKSVVDKLVDLFVQSGELKSAPNLSDAYYLP